MYTQIKNRLILSFAVSKEARLQQLLRGEVISDGKPSLLLNRLRALNTGGYGDDTRQILATLDNLGLQSLTQIAYKISEAFKPSEISVSAISSNQTDIAAIPSLASAAVAIFGLTSMMEEFSKQLKEFTNSIRENRSRLRSRA